MSEITYYQRNRETILNRTNDYYKNSKKSIKREIKNYLKKKKYEKRVWKKKIS